MSTEAALAASPYSHKHPFFALHPVNRRLSGAGSEKDTRHHEISLAGSGLSYLPGDALGLVPQNCPALVEELLTALHATGDELVPGKDGAPKPLRDALRTDFAIHFAEKKFVEAAAQRGAEKLATLLQPENSDALKVYLTGRNHSRDYVDLLRECPGVTFAAEEFVKLLRKLPPRLYSIASSLQAHPDSVHLTVATVRYESRGRAREGVASTFLAKRWPADRKSVV